jgi:hypothetical protein
MKLAWIRLVFVLCTLSALLYVGIGLTCILANDGKAYPFDGGSPESAGIFVGTLAFSVGLVITLHVFSFVFTGKTEHLECMLAWLVPPLVIAVISFLAGKSVSQGWETAFAIPCNGIAAIGLAAGTIGFMVGVIYGEHYGKLTKLP